MVLAELPALLRLEAKLVLGEKEKRKGKDGEAAEVFCGKWCDGGTRGIEEGGEMGK